MADSENVLGEDIREFLSCFIDSVGTLELILLFARHPEKIYSIDQLVGELRNNRAATEIRLCHLKTRGLIDETSPQHYRYGPNSKVLEETIAKTLPLYKKYQARFIDAIYGNVNRPMRCFAEAFRFKKEDGDG